LPATGSTQNAIQVSELVCGAPPECNTVTCVPGPAPCDSPEACDGPGVGCVVTPAFDSTPCGTDTDGNDCTAPGCEAGTCVQTHILDPESTVCGTDTTPTDCTAPGCTATGVCSQTHNDVPVSTTCGTDTDGNDCTAPGCDGAGTCVQTHTLDPESTVCGTDTDPTDCTTPGCTATGECSQTHTLVPESDPCGTDTDGLTCTIPGCTAAGTCNQTHIDTCVGEEICRTPGFWGTHGGVEKASSTNITLALLNAYNAANDPDLTICGTPITNTTECSQNSALEAICVSPKGDSLLQLGRQLTAAALNCIITNSTEPNGEICPSAGLTGGVCSGVSIEGIFSACNAACEAGNTTALVDLDNDPATPDVEVSCIGAIDCFNNGGAINETTGECDGSTECHDRDLVQGCFNFQPPGAAGSPRECNDSRKNCVTIFGNLSDCTDTCP
jgi:hypothetical protein